MYRGWQQRIQERVQWQTANLKIINSHSIALKISKQFAQLFQTIIKLIWCKLWKIISRFLGAYKLSRSIYQMMSLFVKSMRILLIFRKLTSFRKWDSIRMKKMIRWIWKVCHRLINSVLLNFINKIFWLSNRRILITYKTIQTLFTIQLMTMICFYKDFYKNMKVLISLILLINLLKLIKIYNCVLTQHFLIILF